MADMNQTAEGPKEYYLQGKNLKIFVLEMDNFKFFQVRRRKAVPYYKNNKTFYIHSTN